MTRWKRNWHNSPAQKTTADVIAYVLTDAEGGAVERAETIAENTAEALGRLAEALEDKGVFTTDEIKTIFQIYGFEPVEDEA